jgi:hypothetical protein
MGKTVTISAEVDIDDMLEDATDQQIIDEYFKRDLHDEELDDNIQSIPSPRYSPNDPEKIILFNEYADHLTLDQWRHIFKDVARMSFEARRCAKAEVSNLLELTT